ncbi:hypothetical protein FGG08_004436 [Glutinoglossum americanum]|uniref:F-box domain-containing protein n=1 Tax=Glutinoglossum americanum TaxID=1670608 RepID=A0A9P8I538_9PEZI|nr:hypothetical protein FGG08_004436 [Glutinoglossum americanum]
MEGDLGESPVDVVDRDVGESGAEDSTRRTARATPQDEDVAPSSGDSAGKGKSVVRKPAFEKLPAEIIEQILYLADPSSFASLVLLNSDWHRASQSHHLYAHQLSRCHSFVPSNGHADEQLYEGDLPRLRRQFELEIKRNLFDSYLRPKETIIKLISTSAVSSTAFPGGEAFHFSFSPGGRLVLACSSSRIVILDVSSATVSVKRELKVLRRPVSVAILDDGSVLAVLSTDLQVNLYSLTEPRANHLRSISLDDSPRTIALSPGGSVLAAAYDGGIEVYSLAPYALSTHRRAVKCDAVDSLSFSSDGTLLLGTTLHSPNPNTVILSAPFYNEVGHDVPISELLSQMWTTQILFPNSSRDCSHATLLPCAAEGEASWTFTHDRVFETFRAVRVDDLRNGTTYFTGPTATGVARRSLPSTLPAASDNGELVAAGFAGDIWLYGVPADLDFAPDLNQLDTGTAGDSGAGTPSSSINGVNGIPASATIFPQPPQPTATGSDEGSARPPQWQVLCDKFRNVFVKGRRVATVDGLSAVRWVSQSSNGKSRETWSGERLVAVAPGGVDEGLDDREEGIVPVDGGRVVMFDFERGVRNGGKHIVTIEVGESQAELLLEETRDLEAEVAIFRRRTVAKRRGGIGSRPDIEGSAATAATSSSSRRSLASRPGSTYVGQAPSLLLSPASASLDSADELTSFEEVQEALDLPYSHTDPRSRTSLQRAATAVAANRLHNPLRVAEPGQVAYLRADGRRDPPHESDADNWVPPPPPYTPDPEIPLPEHLRLTLLPRRTEPLQRVSDPPPTPVRAQTTLEGMTRGALQRTRSTLERAGSTFRARRASIGRSPNDTTSIAPDDQQHTLQTESRPVTSSAALPPGASFRGNTIPRRPVGANPGVRSFIEPSSPRSLITDPLFPQSPRTGSYERMPQPAQHLSIPVTRSSNPLIYPPQSSAPSSPTTVGSTPPIRRSNNLLYPGQHISGHQARARSVPDLRLSPSEIRPYALPYDQNIDSVYPGAEQPSYPQSRRAATPARSSSHTHSRSSVLSDLFGYPLHPPRATQSVATRPHHLPPNNSRRSPRTSPLHGGSNPTSSSIADPQRRETSTRLDSIHSVPSRNASSRSRTSGPGTMPRRQTSRAGRSAAINIKEARKKGWVKKPRARGGGSEWGGSSAGWTDDTNESTADAEERGEESGGKCMIM